VTFWRATKVFEDGIDLIHLNYLLAFDGITASRGGIALIDQGGIIGAVGCSGATDSQDEVVSETGAAVIKPTGGEDQMIPQQVASSITRATSRRASNQH